jgi:hypothetical protein
VDVGLTAYFFDNNASGPTPDGSFTYDTANGVLTYSAVPEPATFGLLGGFGLLALAFRRHLIKA